MKKSLCELKREAMKENRMRTENELQLHTRTLLYTGSMVILSL